MEFLNLTSDELNLSVCIFSAVISMWSLFVHLRTRANRKTDRKAIAKMVYECLDDERNLPEVIYDFVKMKPQKFLKEKH